MSANTNPIFGRTPDVQWGSSDGNGGTAGPLLTANTAADGTGTVLTVFTADATEGGFVEKIRVISVGTNVQTVLRVFVNNGSTNATIANNVQIDQLTIPATNSNNSGSLPIMEIPVGIALPPGYKLNVTIGTTVAAGLFVSAWGSKY